MDETKMKGAALEGSLKASTGLIEHAEREALNLEVHARPYEPLTAPVQASHLALVSGEGAGEAERAHLALLCQRHGVAPPPEDAKHYSADFGHFRLKWERHTEFTTYTFIRPGAAEAPFADPAIGVVPRDWLGALPGEVIVANHVEIEAPTTPERGAEDLARLFRYDDIVSSRLEDGAAVLWTDLRVHGDGFIRVLLRDVSLTQRQAGRVMQHLMEIGTYRTMALLALPLAREAAPRLKRADEALVDITARMASPDSAADERALLGELSGTAAEIERLAARTNYRFGAARAYYAIVCRRLDELREARVEGFQTLNEFMVRRLAPAMETCENVARRQAALSERLSQASDLLRTRVDIALEDQNRALLVSMDRRARLQLRLQQTVEGLSAAAITYYVVSLLGYAFRALATMGAAIDVELARGLSIVPVALLVWLGVRRIRRAVFQAEARGEDGGRKDGEKD